MRNSQDEIHEKKSNKRDRGTSGLIQRWKGSFATGAIADDLLRNCSATANMNSTTDVRTLVQQMSSSIEANEMRALIE